MSLRVHILSAHSEIWLLRRELTTNVTRALRRIERLLPFVGQNVDVVVRHEPSATIPGVGIGGYTPHAHLVEISVDAKRRSLRRVVREHLPRTLAHELHHAVRWLRPGYGATIGEAFVTEGLAAHFEQEVFGGLPNPWDVALHGATLRRMWRRAVRSLWKSPYNHEAWFFGSKHDRIPRWTGYALGFDMVRKYLTQRPDVRPSRLVNIPARTILSA